MNSIKNMRVYMRSLATRQANLALSAHVNKALDILKVADFDLIILETSGIGRRMPFPSSSIGSYLLKRVC